MQLGGVQAVHTVQAARLHPQRNEVCLLLLLLLLLAGSCLQLLLLLLLAGSCLLLLLLLLAGSCRAAPAGTHPSPSCSAGSHLPCYSLPSRVWRRGARAKVTQSVGGCVQGGGLPRVSRKQRLVMLGLPRPRVRIKGHAPRVDLSTRGEAAPLVAIHSA